jgi:putative ABC transport system substrate-binding protein
LIAKDHLIASGATTLAQAASRLHIPFVASDDGSVASGAAVAMGNKEVDIGRKGGEIAIQLLEGAKPSEIPISSFNAYTVFVNPTALDTQGLSIKQIQEAAQRLGYPVEAVQ